MHVALDLKVLYFGTPVVLIGSRNPDGTSNLAPMSSAWWLGQSCMLGLGNSGQTTANLLRERRCVLNLAPSSLVGAVDRLFELTGTRGQATTHACSRSGGTRTWRPRTRPCSSSTRCWPSHRQLVSP